MAEYCKLAVIGDPHVAVPQGENDPRLEIDPGRKLHGLSVELLAATIEAVNAEPDVAAALIMGDLTRDSEEFNHATTLDLLSRLRMPYYIVLGNHDLVRERPAGVTYDGAKRFEREDVLAFYGRAGFPNGLTRYVVKLPGSVVLVVLDSNRSLTELAAHNLPLSRQEDGWLGESQLAWLDGVLEQITSAGRVPLVATHYSLLEQSPGERQGHMLHSAFRQWRLTDAQATLEVLRRHHVRLVLSGHLHVQSVNVDDGVYNVITSATVSYPHAWRLIHCDSMAFGIESRRIASIPSCPNLQEQSRAWMAQGMARLIRLRLQGMPLIGNMADEACSFVMRTDWWPRFCDGTLAGFEVDPQDAPICNPVAGMLMGQVAGILNEYGAWKAARPDPNSLEIPLRG
jgi:calcineurin-like phosphoesterase family protein